MYRFFFVVLFCFFTNLLFSQPASINHKFTNEFATGVQDVGIINVQAITGTMYISAPIYHTLTSTQTGSYNAWAWDNQQYQYNNDTYVQKFEKWITANYPEVFTKSYTYTTYEGYISSSDVSHVAKFLSEHNITIRSIMPFYGDHSEQVTLNYKGNNSTLNATAITYIVDTKTLTVTFLNDFWYENIHFYNSKTNPMTLTPNAYDPKAMALIMTHTGIPEWPAGTPRNLAASPTSSGSEAKVRLTWNEHPNQYVSKYEIWRICNTPQHPNETKKIGEVSRGTTSFVDYDFYYYYGGATSVPTTVQYDVRAYYPIEGTYSPTDYISVPLYYHELSKKTELATEIPTEYSIGNFPNPFNPTTTIKYQLPEAGFVTLKVYDILGKEVTTLVNENKSTGYYEVNFDASRLTSGIYIYTIQAGKYTESKKMILTK